jgi:hypothetical protein
MCDLIGSFHSDSETLVEGLAQRGKPFCLNCKA